jgi:hypothetical protein
VGVRGTLALTALRAALAAGFNDFEQMQTDPDLAVLHDRPASKELLPKSSK